MNKELQSKVAFANIKGCTFFCDPVSLAFIKSNGNDIAKNVQNAYDFSWEDMMHNSAEMKKYISEIYSASRPSYRAMSIEVHRNSVVYIINPDYYSVMRPSNNADRIAPLSSTNRAIRSEYAENIYKSVKDALGGEARNDGLFLNLWRLAAKNVEINVDEVINSIDSRIADIEPYRIYQSSVAVNRVPMPKKNAEPKPVSNVVERVIERTVEKATPLEDMLQQTVCNMVAQIAVDDMVPRIKERIVSEFGFEPIRHEIKINDVKLEINDVVHEKFDTAMFYIANNIPLYLYGPAGSGKNHMVEQIAEALRMDFYTMNCVTEEYKFNGFVDVNGNYHESEFYKAFTKGGLFFLDELDASAPDVLVNLNAAIANGYYPFPNGTKRAHENFRVVAAGNTLGTGADAAYTGRNQLDAATLNRFVVIPVDYDERIDLVNAMGDNELVDFVNGYRIAAKRCGVSTVCSYRNVKMIKVSSQQLPIEDALCYCLTKEMNKDDINTIIGQFPQQFVGNKYYNALSKIKPMC